MKAVTLFTAVALGGQLVNAAVISPRLLGITPPPPIVPAGTPYGVYTSLCCWQDTGTYPALLNSADNIYMALLSLDLCATHCFTRGYKHMGVANANWCLCDNVIDTGGGAGYKTTADKCTMACAGNPLQNCGDYWRNVMFQTTTSYAADQAAAVAASASSSLAAFSAAASAAAYSSAYSASSVAAAASLSAFSAAANAAYSASSVAASLAAYSAATNAAQSAATAASLAAYSAASNAAYSASSVAASLVAYSAATAAAQSAATAASLAAYSAASNAAYSASTAAASLAAYSAAQGAIQSAAAAASAAAYSAASEAAYSASSVAASLASYSAGVLAVQSAAAAASLSAYSAASNAAYSASSVAASLAAYSAAAGAAQSAAAAASLSAYSAASNAAYSATAAASAAAQSVSLAAYSASVSASAAAYSAIAASPPPSPWAVASTPCIAEGTTGRALIGDSTQSTSMTIDMCINYCNSKNFAIAGLEFASECYCGNALSNGASTSKSSSQCIIPCAGQPAKMCGGPNALNLYVIPSKISNLNSDLTPKAASLPSGWSAASTSCVAEGTSGRALTGASTTDPNMTPTLCINFCTGKGFTYAGTEYGTECYCGNSLTNGASLSTSSPNCNMACPGERGSTCGGPNALNLYHNPNVAPVSSSGGSSSSGGGGPISGTLPTGWSGGSCIQEVDGRALTGASTADNTMTIPKCLNFCKQKGFTMAGLEYSSECFCGSGLSNGGSTSKTSNNCNMPCSGDSTTTCGGPNAIQLYMNPSAAPPPAPVAVINGYTAVGCIQEVSGRALTGLRVDYSDMTLDKCIAACKNGGFKYAGAEYGTECYCGNSLVNGASTSSKSGQCVMDCPGNTAQKCGGPNAITLFSS